MMHFSKYLLTKEEIQEAIRDYMIKKGIDYKEIFKIAISETDVLVIMADKELK